MYAKDAVTRAVVVTATATNTNIHLAEVYDLVYVDMTSQFLFSPLILF